MRAQFPRFFCAGLLSVSALLLGAPAALAHVSAESDAAEPGERATVRFRVPNESDSASTVRLKVALPAEYPLTQVSPAVVEGWKISTTGDDGAVTEIVWQGGKIPPGQFAEFPVRLGPLPESVDQLMFKAVQTYSDGEVVRWIEEPEPGQPEPEHPAPTLAIERHEHPPAPVDDSDTLARLLGGGGLAAGLAALGVVLAGRRRPESVDAPAEAERPKQAAGV